MELEEAFAKIKEIEQANADLTAKNEDIVKHSHEWESRAKANKAKADEL